MENRLERRTITRGILFDGRPDWRPAAALCGGTIAARGATCRCAANNRSGRSTYSGTLPAGVSQELRNGTQRTERNNR
jgi:hypothetical protein